MCLTDAYISALIFGKNEVVDQQEREFAALLSFQRGNEGLENASGVGVIVVVEDRVVEAYVCGAEGLGGGAM